MKNVLVTGANRGIGLELVRQLAAGVIPETRIIIATCRDPENAQELKAIRDSSKVKVEILKLDVSNDDHVSGLLSEVQKVLGPKEGLQVLINNAGYGPTLSLEDTTAFELNKMFAANITGPFVVMKALLPLLRMSADQSPGASMSCFKSAVINISSGLGSMRSPLPDVDHRNIGFLGYSPSKAALNLLMRYMSTYTLPWGVLVVLMHPGWVKTDMGSQAAPLTTKDSVDDMLPTITSMNENHHGGFFNEKGEVLDW